MIVHVDTDSEANTPIRLSADGINEPLHLTLFEAHKLYFQLWAALMEVDPEMRQPDQDDLDAPTQD